MGLDVYLYRYENHEDSLQREKKYEEYSESIWVKKYEDYEPSQIAC